MRIISGSHKGRRIQAPKNLPVRPTTDMAKEALFNILRSNIDIHGATVLELFAGSGNITYELLSRGASHVHTVDIHQPCTAFIQKTAENLGFTIQSTTADVFEFLKNHGQSYDLIFADPPYDFDQESFSAIATLVYSRNLLRPGGLLVIEHSKHTDLSGEEYFVNTRRYGGTAFTFFAAHDDE